MEGDRTQGVGARPHRNFNPLPPHGGRRTEWSLKSVLLNFNPLPPHGGRRAGFSFACTICQFQSTPSAWRETHRRSIHVSWHCYFNPLPPHGGRHYRLVTIIRARHFNPLPPHGGRPLMFCYCPSVRNFNPLPPHGGRRSCRVGCKRIRIISIHSLRMEGDEGTARKTVFSGTFQSTPSAWRETKEIPGEMLSIGNFNPLPPHGGRRRSFYIPKSSFIFQSTPSAWRETRSGLGYRCVDAISIHSLRMEGDRNGTAAHGWSLHFNPLPPHGGRLARSCIPRHQM